MKIGIRIKSKILSRRIPFTSFLCYFIMIPFLHPRGFDEYFDWYKELFTLWLYAAILLVGVLCAFDLCRKNFAIKKSMVAILVYYAAMLGGTLMIQKGVGEGLQKMIAAPFLCIACSYYFQRNCKGFLNCICNLLLIDLGLTVVVFNPLFFGSLFRDELHLMFIGHVQIGAQLGILGIMLAYVLYQIYGWELRSALLLLFSAGTMVLSLTSASFMALAIIAAGGVYMKLSKKQKLLKQPPQVYLIGYLAANFGMFKMLELNNWLMPFSFLSLNGRNFIWREAFRLAAKKPLFGYGVHGALIKVFWSYWVGDGKGMNYAHNQIMQSLLDGGIVLLLLFLLMVFLHIRPARWALPAFSRFGYVCLAAVFVVMTVEAPLEYYYYLIFFSMLAYIPEICKLLPMQSYLKGIVLKQCQ